MNSPSSFPPKAPRRQAESSLKGPHHDFQMLIARALDDGSEGKIGFDEQSPNVFQPRAAYLNGRSATEGLGEPMLQRTARHKKHLLQITDLQRLVRMGADVAERIGHERIVHRGRVGGLPLHNAHRRDVNGPSRRAAAL